MFSYPIWKNSTSGRVEEKSWRRVMFVLGERGLKLSISYALHQILTEAATIPTHVCPRRIPSLSFPLLPDRLEQLFWVTNLFCPAFILFIYITVANVCGKIFICNLLSVGFECFSLCFHMHSRTFPSFPFVFLGKVDSLPGKDCEYLKNLLLLTKFFFLWELLGLESNFDST